MNLTYAYADFPAARQSYDYAPKVDFRITQTGNLSCVGEYLGVYRRIPPAYIGETLTGVNLRQFERICFEVFHDCSIADEGGWWTPRHMENLKSISRAIVMWKDWYKGASEARKFADEFIVQWNIHSKNDLLTGFRKEDLSSFTSKSHVGVVIGSAFLRFLYPQSYGIADSRIFKNYKGKGFTDFPRIDTQGKIQLCPENIAYYTETYLPFLQNLAIKLNNMPTTFRDANCNRETFDSPFRPCDVDMALYAEPTLIT